MWQPLVDKATGRRLIKHQAILLAIGLVSWYSLDWLAGISGLKDWIKVGAHILCRDVIGC